MYDKCYFCLDQLPKLKKESTASFFVNFGGAGVQKSRPTLLYMNNILVLSILVFFSKSKSNPMSNDLSSMFYNLLNSSLANAKS